MFTSLSSARLRCGSALLIVAASLSVAPVYGGDLFTLGAAKDNTLYEDGLGELSNGAGQHFFTGRAFQPEDSIRRGLIAFDLSEIPAGSTVTAVTLTLNMSQTIAGDKSVSLHRVLADWGEGASDAPPGPGGGSGEGGGTGAEKGDATWLNTFFPTDQWTTPGGDFAEAASATESVGGPGVYTWGSSNEMVADVQSWLNDPASNFGWIVVGEEAEFPTAKRFDSRESPDPSARPVLTIEVGSDCEADANGDGAVNVIDLIAVITDWGQSDSIADVNDDGVVNVLDLVKVITEWGDCP